MTEKNVVPDTVNKSYALHRKNKVHSRQKHKFQRPKSADRLLDGVKGTYETGSILDQSLPDSEKAVNEILSPFEMNVAVAYKHLKNENDRLNTDLEKLKVENDKIRLTNSKLREENATLREDVSLMKNLVFKLNLELDRYQSGGKPEGMCSAKLDKLPKNYDKNFLKPIVPLLKAYSESIQEKDETIKELESEYKKFNAAFGDLLRENEKLYAELEKKFADSRGDDFNEVNILKKDLEMAKQENNLLFEQIKLEKEKLVKIHSVYKVKVEEASKEKEGIECSMEECKSDLLLLKGKYAVLKQEFDRLKVENEARVPLAVHSASVNECRRLFQDLKTEYENEKGRLTCKIRELEDFASRRDKQEEKLTEERNTLEKTNFSQTFEIEALTKKISELESQLAGKGKFLISENRGKEINELRKQLSEANKKNEELNKKLSTTRKQLQKAMVFAEDIVQGQETLLLQLHNKQKENNYMNAQFGSLKNRLKDVERGAQEGLNSVEEKMKKLERENHGLTVENRKLEKLLADKEDFIKKMNSAKDSSC